MKIGQQTVKEFTYDSAGRTTAVETSAGTTSLSYDYESRVTGITYPSQSTNSFTYNGLDTRVGMSDSGGSKTFLRDGASVTSPVLSDGSADYTPAISERRSSTTTFYHAGIKNGDSQSSTGQSVTASIQYDAFGNVTSSSGTWQGPFAYGGPYGYQSDPDSGLKLLGHRYYDPSTGRFLTRDPIKDGRNWYGYCANNPIRFVDPTGCFLVLLLAGAGVAAGIYGLIELGKYMTEKAEEGRRNRDAMMYLLIAGNDVGYEGGEYAGLGVVPGKVVRFDFSALPGGRELKVPHMGWNPMIWKRDCPLMKGLTSPAHFYFVHSYYVAPVDEAVSFGRCDYGGEFTAMIWRDNLFATQFHPEKSQSAGLTMLKNFAAI